MLQHVEIQEGPKLFERVERITVSQVRTAINKAKTFPDDADDDDDDDDADDDDQCSHHAIISGEARMIVPCSLLSRVCPVFTICSTRSPHHGTTLHSTAVLSAPAATTPATAPRYPPPRAGPILRVCCEPTRPCNSTRWELMLLFQCTDKLLTRPPTKV